MRAGRLRHRVTIQARSGAKDGYGQLVDDWQAIAIRRCAIEPLNGREFFAAERENTETRVRVRFRHEPGLLSESMRLVGEGMTLDIENIINPNQRNRELVVMCRHASTN